MIADFLVAFLDIALDHNTFYHVFDIGGNLSVVHDFLYDADLFLEFLAGIGVVDIDHSSRIDEIHFLVHLAESDQIFIVVILCGVAVLADRTAKHNVCERVAGCLDFIAAVYEVVWVLCGIDGIEHDGKVAAGRVLHAGSHIKTAHGETVLLILDGTRADGDIGQQVFHIAPVLRRASRRRR